MTTNHMCRPFITRFAVRLPASRGQLLRYDEVRQQAQVLCDGVWLDASAAFGAAAVGTRATRVKQETTDDE